jgi:hypothetical protein
MPSVTAFCDLTKETPWFFFALEASMKKGENNIEINML